MTSWSAAVESAVVRGIVFGIAVVIVTYLFDGNVDIVYGIVAAVAFASLNAIVTKYRSG